MLTDQEIRIKALEVSARIRAALVEKMGGVPMDYANRVVDDARKYELYIKTGER